MQQRIGYCPQFDALIERLTGREFLTMFARLRGIHEKAIKGVVQSVIDRLDLSKYADKKCGTYRLVIYSSFYLSSLIFLSPSFIFPLCTK